jgi:hypothetical protein
VGAVVVRLVLRAVAKPVVALQVVARPETGE